MWRVEKGARTAVADRERYLKHNLSPLLLGVTGHRNLASDNESLAALVAKELRRLARAYPGARFAVLTGLAEGADRLAANVAQDRFDANVIAVLPLPDQLYLADFATPESRAEYLRLKAEAGRLINAPLLEPRRKLRRDGESRNHQYAWVGAFLAKRAQVLLAIWDGEAARGTGGTAQAVEWFRSSTTPRRYRISAAPRLKGREGVTRELIHINPGTLKVRRFSLVND